MSLKKNDAVCGFIVPPKKIMRRFSLNEISAVDTPAQEPALVTMLKRFEFKPVGVLQMHDSKPMHPSVVALSKTLDDLIAKHKSQPKKETTVAKTAELTNDDFNMIAKAVQLRHGCSPRDARMAVSLALQDGTLGKKLTGQEVATIAQLNIAAKAEKSGANFEQLIAGIRKAKGSSRADALRQARREHPEAFASWQG